MCEKSECAKERGGEVRTSNAITRDNRAFARVIREKIWREVFYHSELAHVKLKTPAPSFIAVYSLARVCSFVSYAGSFKKFWHVIADGS